MDPEINSGWHNTSNHLTTQRARRYEYILVARSGTGRLLKEDAGMSTFSLPLLDK